MLSSSVFYACVQVDHGAAGYIYLSLLLSSLSKSSPQCCLVGNTLTDQHAAAALSIITLSNWNWTPSRWCCRCVMLLHWSSLRCVVLVVQM